MRRSTAGRLAGRTAAVVAAAMLVLVALLAIVTVTGFGMSLLVPPALRLAAPEGWTVDVGDVDGGWRSRVTLRDLEMEGPDASASVQELSIDFRLLPLLSRTLQLQEVRVIQPAVHAVLTSPGTGAHLAEEEQEASSQRLLADSLLGAWAVELDAVEVRGARAVLLRADGAYTISAGRLRGHAALGPSGLRIRVDSLWAEVAPPAPADSLPHESVGPGRLALAAELEDGLLEVRGLSFDSPRSSLRASGRLLLAASPSLVDSVDFQLAAEPLDLRDLPMPLPDPWIEQPRITGWMSARGAVDSMVVEAHADGPGESAFDVQAVLRMPADASPRTRAHGSPALEATAELSGDLSPWSLGPLTGDATALLDLRLDSLSLDGRAVAQATVIHRPRADTVGGLIGRSLRVDLDLTRGATPLRTGAPGPGDTPADVEATATLHAAFGGPEDWRELGVLHAVGTEQRTDWRVSLELDTGVVAGSGSAQWGERLQVVVDRLALENFDASAVAAELPPTDVTALLEGRLSGAAVDDLSGTVALQVSPSSFSGTPVESATLRAQLDPGAVVGAMMADAAGRQISSDFELALSDSLVSATLSELRVSTPADSTAIDTLASTPSELEVRGSATGSWWLAETRRATFSLSIDSALVAGLPMSDGALEGRLVGDSVIADASLRVQEVLFAPTRLEASLRARGTTAADMTGRLEAWAVRTPAADAPSPATGADSLILAVDVDEPGRFVMNARLLPAEGGRLDANGTAVVVDDSLSFDLLAGGSIPTPVDLLRQGTLDTLRVEASGIRRASEWEALTAQLLVRNATWSGVIADSMRFAMSADSTGFRVDTLAVQSEVLTLAGGGTLPQRGAGEGQIQLRAHFELEPLRDIVEAELPQIGDNAVVASIAGTTDSLDVTTELEVAALSYGSVEIAGISAEARLLMEPPFSERFGITSGAADIELDAIALPDTDVQNLAASLTGSPDSLLMEVSARVDGERTGELVASIDPRPDARTARLERFQLQLDEDQWGLAQPAQISYADGYALRSFHLTTGEQAILIDGGVTGAGALDLSMQMDSTDVGTVSDLLGLPRLEGWLGGTVELEGTVDEPVGDADLRAGFHVEGRPPTTADLRLEIEGRQVLVDALLRDPTGGTLAVAGSMPYVALRRPAADTASGGAPRARADTPVGAGESAALDLQVSADLFDVSSAVAFVDSELLATLDGRVDANLEVGGTLRSPRLQGPVELSGGQALLPELGVTWEEMSMHARGDGNRLVVDSAQVRSGPGSLSLTGNATLDGTVALDLTTELQSFQAIRNEEYRAVVSGSLRIGGSPTRPEVEGDIQVESLDVYIGESTTTANLIDVELTEEDLEILRDRFGYVTDSGDEDVPLSEFLSADLTVELSRDSWLRKRAAPEMAVPFTGEVSVQIRPRAEPLLQGTVTTIAERGYIQQFGKRFEPREGTVTLDGPPDSARVDLAATYSVPSHGNPDNAEATIVLRVEGTQDDLSLTLTSEPPMENADIVSYVATGRPAASNLALGEGTADEGGENPPGGLAEAGAGVALNQIIGAVERAAQEGVGLDVVEIRREGIRSATLVAGKYLSPKLYVGFAQPVTHQDGDGLSLGDEAETEVEIEYQALRGLLLNVEGSDSALRIFLRGRFAY